MRNGASGNYPGGVNGGVGPIVVVLDVLEVGRILECRVVPIQLLHPAVVM